MRAKALTTLASPTPRFYGALSSIEQAIKLKEEAGLAIFSAM
jgi:hypothetical protein